MRILVDCAFVSANSVITGIPRVVFKYLEHGQAYARKHGVTVLPVYVRPEGVFDARYALPDWVRRGFGEVPLAEAEAADALHRRHAYLRRVVAPATRTLAVSLRAVGLDRLIEHARAAYHRRNQARMLSIGSGRPIPIEPGDVLFMPALWHDEAPESYRHAKDAGARIVPLLHDVLPITTPEHYDAKWRQTFARSVVAVAGLADHLMYVSEATQADFVPVLTRAGTDEPPHSVHHHGADFAMPGEAHAVSADVKAFLRGSEPRVLVVGTIEPKKNHAAAIAACQSLWASGVSFRLCIIGRPSWQSEPTVAAIEAAAAHPAWGRNLAWFRDASDADLAFAYANSELCLLPSQAEGFGLPLIEALTRKLPVLASGIPVFREIAGDHATYFDLAAPSGLADGLAGLISEPKRLEAARRRAAAFRWPDWAAQCERTFDMLCGIAKGRGT